MTSFRRYVAIGDSSTEGIDDPDGNGGYRGWADRLAELIAAANPGLDYANLAVRGRTTKEILQEQLPVALGMKPDLVSAVAGMNDLIRPRFDAGAVVAEVEEMHAAPRAIGATVVTFTLPSPGPGMPLARLLGPRVNAFNRALRASAKRTGAVVLDLARHPVTSDPRMWSQDKLHANSAGHERIARGLAWVLGLPGADDSWSRPLPPARKRPFAYAILDDLAWTRTHLVPWIGRRIRGESSGDGLVAKRPVPLPVATD